MSASAGAGRFAPSPSGDLHVGNLRTALLADLFARSTGRAFLIRVEDLDTGRSSRPAAHRQLADLAAIGLSWDGPVEYQSERTPRYRQAIDDLRSGGLVYECFCTRREIQQAATAPHAPPGAYPGTCRNLTEAQRVAARSERTPALRLRAGVTRWSVHDEMAGDYTGVVDDLVLQRGDGAASYNLAVVVDDAAQGIDQVVRGDDLLPSTPRQAYLCHLLGLPVPAYAHVPLVLGVHGRRLAKRDGAVTLTDLGELGVGPDRVLTLLAHSLGLAGEHESVNLALLRDRFDPGRLPAEPWVIDPAVVFGCPA